MLFPYLPLSLNASVYDVVTKITSFHIGIEQNYPKKVDEAGRNYHSEYNATCLPVWYRNKSSSPQN